MEIFLSFVVSVAAGVVSYYRYASDSFVASAFVPRLCAVTMPLPAASGWTNMINNQHKKILAKSTRETATSRVLFCDYPDGDYIFYHYMIVITHSHKIVNTKKFKLLKLLFYAFSFLIYFTTHSPKNQPPQNQSQKRKSPRL